MRTIRGILKQLVEKALWVLVGLISFVFISLVGLFGESIPDLLDSNTSSGTTDVSSSRSEPYSVTKPSNERSVRRLSNSELVTISRHISEIWMQDNQSHLTYKKQFDTSAIVNGTPRFYFSLGGFSIDEVSKEQFLWGEKIRLRKKYCNSPEFEPLRLNNVPVASVYKDRGTSRIGEIFVSNLDCN